MGGRCSWSGLAAVAAAAAATAAGHDRTDGAGGAGAAGDGHMSHGGRDLAHRGVQGPCPDSCHPVRRESVIGAPCGICSCNSASVCNATSEAAARDVDVEVAVDYLEGDALASTQIGTGDGSGSRTGSARGGRRGGAGGGGTETGGCEWGTGRRGGGRGRRGPKGTEL